MSKHDIIMAGFGGQGVMSMGTLLTYAGMIEGKNVSWIPSYGPEMRGGTANCSVVISDSPIASPLVTKPTAVIAMNLPSLDKFESWLEPGGVLIINSSMVNRKAQRDDIIVVEVPANEVAQELGSSRIANMVALGAYVTATGAVKAESVLDSLKEALPAHRHNLIPLNKEALERGGAFAQQDRSSGR